MQSKHRPSTLLLWIAFTSSAVGVAVADRSSPGFWLALAVAGTSLVVSVVAAAPRLRHRKTA
jgi:hypothetical protein